MDFVAFSQTTLNASRGRTIGTVQPRNSYRFPVLNVHKGNFQVGSEFEGLPESDRTKELDSALVKSSARSLALSGLDITKLENLQEPLGAGVLKLLRRSLQGY